MVQSLKYRGRELHTKKWLYGDLLNEIAKCGHAEIDPKIIELKTVAPFTGAYDPDGKEIYRDDIMLWTDPEDPEDTEHYVVIYEDCAFRLKSVNVPSAAPDIIGEYEKEYCKVVGNIWDNPELLKKGAKR